METKRNYWGFRISTGNAKYLLSELHEGRLRQGWGFEEGQNLKNNTVNKGSSRNKPMLKVKKGDVLLVPRIPNWNEAALVEATEDWNTGYRFEIDKKTGDFGHIFPAKFIKSFVRGSEAVTGNIRSTFKNLGRFWNINRYQEDIEIILNTEPTELMKVTKHLNRFENTISKVFIKHFNVDSFSTALFEQMNVEFQSAEWEIILREGLQRLFPNYEVERTGGPLEVGHGTDILIKIPKVFNTGQFYGIAIQVKDYKEFVNLNAIVAQISKADKYFDVNEQIQLIEKVIIITGAKREDHKEKLKKFSDITFVFAEELEELLRDMSLEIICSPQNRENII